MGKIFCFFKDSKEKIKAAEEKVRIAKNRLEEARQEQQIISATPIKYISWMQRDQEQSYYLSLQSTAADNVKYAENRACDAPTGQEAQALAYLQKAITEKKKADRALAEACKRWGESESNYNNKCKKINLLDAKISKYEKAYTHAQKKCEQLKTTEVYRKLGRQNTANG